MIKKGDGILIAGEYITVHDVGPRGVLMLKGHAHSTLGSSGFCSRLAVWRRGRFVTIDSEFRYSFVDAR